MGEVSKNVSEELKATYSSVNWWGMASMRDKLIHHYFGVDFDLVWEVVSIEVPTLHDQLIEILKEVKE